MKKINLKMAATVMICGAFLLSSCVGWHATSSLCTEYAIWPMQLSLTPLNSGAAAIRWPA